MKTSNTLTMIKLVTFTMFLVSCISFEDTTLDEHPNTSTKVAAPPKSGKGLDLSANYSCIKDWPTVSLSNGALQVGLKEAKGNCFGLYFDMKDITATPVIKVRAKFVPSSKAPSVDMLAGFTDEKGGKNYSPEKGKVVKAGAEYVDYYFDYTKELQPFKDRFVDPTKVKTVLIFVNILGVDNVSGLLTIEEVSLVAKM